VDEMADAVRLIDQIDPEACRRGAERFAAERMCRGYLDVYHSLTGRRGGGQRDDLRHQLLPTSRESRGE
jgi:hypothetical protein